MIDNDIADELEKLVPSGQRSKLVSQAIANELAVQRRKNITSRLLEMRSQIPPMTAEKMQADLLSDRKRG